MSRKLGALALALGILACSMGLKTLLSGGHSNTTAVIAANGPEPMPTPPTAPPKSTK